MSKRKYRVAIVGGAGTWGRYYLRAYAEHPDCEIVALVDRAKERREEFAERHGVETVFDSLDELLAREVPDIVSIILPVAHNFETVAACAKAGVRVVSCEKPIAAELAEADAIVQVCREHGTLLGCSQAAWCGPYTRQTIEWVHTGNIGRLTAAAIPNGLPLEMSGGGCVQLATLRILTEMEVEWVEGWTLPSEPSYVAPPGRPQIEADCPAYGQLGLSGGIVCEMLKPRAGGSPCSVSVKGEKGTVWISHPQPVFVLGHGAESTPVFPEFLDEPIPDNTSIKKMNYFVTTIERLMSSFDTGEEPLSSGHDFHQSLEIAIALKLSAADGHKRVSLPLDDRSLRLYPHPYRFNGGDVAGWKSIGYKGPPEVI